MSGVPAGKSEDSGFAAARGLDEALLDMGLRLTPAQRLRWLETTVEELLPWLGLAGRQISPSRQGRP